MLTTAESNDAPHYIAPTNLESNESNAKHTAHNLASQRIYRQGTYTGTHIHTARHINRHTYRHTNRHTYRKTYRHHTDTHTCAKQAHIPYRHTYMYT